MRSSDVKPALTGAEREAYDRIIFVSYRDSIMNVYSMTDRLVNLYDLTAT